MSSFAEVLQQLDAGQVYNELSDQLTEIVQAVKETRKVGELSIVLKIKPNGENNVFVSETIKPKVPQRPRAETLFFVTSAGHLVRNDPRQPDLPLRRIDEQPQTPIRIVMSHDGVMHDSDGVIIEGAA